MISLQTKLKLKELRELARTSPIKINAEVPALISALEMAIVALDRYSTQHFESCSLSCSKDCDCGLTDAADKALAEIAEMLGKD